MRKKWYWIAPLALLGMAVVITIGGVLVMLLWNWLMPTVFGLKAISFWQAWGLLVLSRLLFAGFGGHGFRRDRMRRRIAERWENMTPEERERSRQKWGTRCWPRMETPTPTPGPTE
jgi:hypothetical protein